MLIDALAVPRFGVAGRQGGLCFTVVLGPWILMLLPGPAGAGLEDLYRNS
jgi:hypothetical protein